MGQEPGYNSRPILAGILWQGLGAWPGFGPSALFLFGGALALIAAALMHFWMPGAIKR